MARSKHQLEANLKATREALSDDLSNAPSHLERECEARIGRKQRELEDAAVKVGKAEDAEVAGELLAETVPTGINVLYVICYITTLLCLIDTVMFCFRLGI